MSPRSRSGSYSSSKAVKDEPLDFIPKRDEAFLRAPGIAGIISIRPMVTHEASHWYIVAPVLIAEILGQ